MTEKFRAPRCAICGSFFLGLRLLLWTGPSALDLVGAGKMPALPRCWNMLCSIRTGAMRTKCLKRGPASLKSVVHSARATVLSLLLAAAQGQAQTNQTVYTD